MCCSYLACHGVLAIAAFIPTKLMWDNFWLHTVVLVCCLGISIWNGGSFYFQVFAKRYLAELEAKARGERMHTTSEKES